MTNINEVTASKGDLNLAFPQKPEKITFYQDEIWVMEIGEEGIKFNRDHPSLENTDEYAKAVIKCIEESLINLRF